MRRAGATTANLVRDQLGFMYRYDRFHFFVPAGAFPSTQNRPGCFLTASMNLVFSPSVSVSTFPTWGKRHSREVQAYPRVRNFMHKRSGDFAPFFLWYTGRLGNRVVPAAAVSYSNMPRDFFRSISLGSALGRFAPSGLESSPPTADAHLRGSRLLKPISTAWEASELPETIPVDNCP